MSMVLCQRPDGNGTAVSGSLFSSLGVSRVPQNLVVRLPITAVRSVDPLDVADDPWPNDVPDPDNPAYVAHALIRVPPSRQAQVR